MRQLRRRGAWRARATQKTKLPLVLLSSACRRHYIRRCPTAGFRSPQSAAPVRAWLEFPAVVDPPFLNAGFSFESISNEASARMPSSSVTVICDGRGRGRFMQVRENARGAGREEMRSTQRQGVLCGGLKTAGRDGVPRMGVGEGSEAVGRRTSINSPASFLTLVTTGTISFRKWPEERAWAARRWDSTASLSCGCDGGTVQA